MFTGPVGPVEVFFYWPEAVLGNFHWPGAIGSPLASSPGWYEGTSAHKGQLAPHNLLQMIVLYFLRN